LRQFGKRRGEGRSRRKEEGAMRKEDSG